MTQMMLSFDAPQSDYVAGTDYTASAEVTVPVVVPAAPRRGEESSGTTFSGTGSRSAETRSSNTRITRAVTQDPRSAGQPGRPAGGHLSDGGDQTTHRMGDLARLVLMRYDLVAQRQSSTNKKRRRK